MQAITARSNNFYKIIVYKNERINKTRYIRPLSRVHRTEVERREKSTEKLMYS